MAAFFTCLQLAGQAFPFAGYENGTSKCRVWQIAFPLLICMHSSISTLSPHWLWHCKITLNVFPVIPDEKNFFNSSFGRGLRKNIEVLKRWQNQYVINVNLGRNHSVMFQAAFEYSYSCDNHMKWTFMIFIALLGMMSHASQWKVKPFLLRNSFPLWFPAENDAIRTESGSNKAHYHKFLLLCVITYLCVFGVICMWMRVRLGFYAF